MMKALFLGILQAISGPVTTEGYAVGQVWEYRTRPSDAGSLLKIQQVTNDVTLGTIYHISVVGFRAPSSEVPGVLAHAPVSKGTLDASVTSLSRRKLVFPDVRPGMAEWKQAGGGVFTITVAEIVDIIDKQVRGSGEQLKL